MIWKKAKNVSAQEAQEKLDRALIDYSVQYQKIKNDTANHPRRICIDNRRSCWGFKAWRL